jgi:hypothetical protein
MNSQNQQGQAPPRVRLAGLLTVAALTLVNTACSAASVGADQYETFLKIAAGYLALLFLLAYGAAVLWKTGGGLGTLIEEKNGGGASMSRFQLLIFTFVVAFGIVFLLAKSDKFPDVPADVLTLIGISASTYAVSKGISASSPTTRSPEVPEATVESSVARNSPPHPPPTR